MLADPHQHIAQLLEDFQVGMMTTRTPNGELHVRPMQLVDTEADCDLVFCAGLDSPKVAEIQADPRVVIAFQSKQKWVAVYGTARVTRDRSRIDALWEDGWSVWFPGGKDDPNLCLIEVDATGGEYWDNRGASGLRFAISALKAVLRGTTPDPSPEEHAKVVL